MVAGRPGADRRPAALGSRRPGIRDGGFHPHPNPHGDLHRNTYHNPHRDTRNATPEAPGIVVEKWVSPPIISPGQDVRITIRVRNPGTQPVSRLVVEDTLPAYLQILTVRSTRGIPAISGQTVRVSVGTLEPGGQVTITIEARARADVPAGTAVENVAVASYDGGRSTGQFPQPTPERPICPLVPETGQTSSTIRVAVLLILMALVSLAIGIATQRREL